MNEKAPPFGGAFLIPIAPNERYRGRVVVPIRN
jgi:hypothetical protein